MKATAIVRDIKCDDKYILQAVKKFYFLAEYQVQVSRYEISAALEKYVIKYVFYYGCPILKCILYRAMSKRE